MRFSRDVPQRLNPFSVPSGDRKRLGGRTGPEMTRLLYNNNLHTLHCGHFERSDVTTHRHQRDDVTLTQVKKMSQDSI